MSANPIPDPTQQPTPSPGGKVRDFASGIFQGLAGAAGNQGLYDRIAAQRQQQRNQVGAGQQMSIQAHALAVKGLRQKLAQLDPQKDAQAYQQTVDQIQANIHARREIVNPDQHLPAGEWLKTHLTDRMHITNHDARVKQLQAKQQAGVGQDQQTAQAIAQGTPTTPNTMLQKYNEAMQVPGATPEASLGLVFPNMVAKTDKDKFIEEKIKAGETHDKAEQEWISSQQKPLGGKEALLDSIYKRMAEPGYKMTPEDQQQLIAAGVKITPDDKIQITSRGEIISTNTKDGTFKVLRGPQAAYKPAGVAALGTWTVDEGPDGKPVLFNSKTGEQKAAPEGMHKAGYYDKNIAPLEAAKMNITDYLKSGTPNGPDDLALQHEFFTATQPATGFRMTAIQQKALQDAQSLWNSMQAKVQHTASGIMFSDEQRKQIADAALKAIAAKESALQGGGQSSGGGGKTIVVSPEDMK